MISFSNVVTGWWLTWLRYDAEDQDEEPYSYFLQVPYGEDPLAGLHPFTYSFPQIGAISAPGE